MIFGEIESFFSLIERIYKPFKSKKEQEPLQTELLSTRLVKAFEAHGVHRNQIPKVLGFELTVNDVFSDEKFLSVLTEEVLDSACNLLGIKRDWLDGASKKIYETYDFYKHPYDFIDFIHQLIERSGTDKIDGVLLTVRNSDRRSETLLIIQEVIGHINDKPFYRYYLCNNWVFSYWKSRAYLTACVAVCWKNKIHVSGKYVTSSFIEKYAYGCNLLAFGSEGIYEINGNSWYAEDLALEPEAYLDGVDPELENYGLKSALSLWLQLNKQGLMDCGLPGIQASKKFEQALNCKV
ncbi:hypothetical protein ACOIPL_001332 [Vibrio fluvialis]|uniref:hypothetical protein n=1 Tax=Vibrio sp. bablab_jr001 TaxID=2755067 RepID=UPI0018F18955|nr:hypothetical protein [Vibrio sp. bablab_jr001]ELE8119471.1 hypothetical protein [Vibrio fluvialis]